MAVKQFSDKPVKWCNDMDSYRSTWKDKQYRADQNVQVIKNRIDYVDQMRGGQKELLQIWKKGKRWNDGRYWLRQRGVHDNGKCDGGNEEDQQKKHEKEI